MRRAFYFTPTEPPTRAEAEITSTVHRLRALPARPLLLGGGLVGGLTALTLALPSIGTPQAVFAEPAPEQPPTPHQPARPDPAPALAVPGPLLAAEASLTRLTSVIEAAEHATRAPDRAAPEKVSQLVNARTPEIQRTRAELAQAAEALRALHTTSAALTLVDRISRAQDRAEALLARATAVLDSGARAQRTVTQRADQARADTARTALDEAERAVHTAETVATALARQGGEVIGETAEQAPARLAQAIHAAAEPLAQARASTVAAEKLARTAGAEATSRASRLAARAGQAQRHVEEQADRLPRLQLDALRQREDVRAENAISAALHAQNAARTVAEDLARLNQHQPRPPDLLAQLQHQIEVADGVLRHAHTAAAEIAPRHDALHRTAQMLLNSARGSLQNTALGLQQQPSPPVATPATPSTPAPLPPAQPLPTKESAPPPSAARDAGARAVQAALTQLGVPYRWGGTTPRGFDCSGLTQWAYRQAGVNIPRTSGAQAVGARIERHQLRPGDLIVWRGHVAMFIGDGRMVEAGNPVQISKVRTSNLGMPFLGFYRPTAR
ncbi:C40 family peptidase [Crossiella equi]|uniref:C40 family peptidase n=1 Tax=Crossiella equi TaxID=130796 RepID=UPI0035576861